MRNPRLLAMSSAEWQRGVIQGWRRTHRDDHKVVVSRPQQLHLYPKQPALLSICRHRLPLPIERPAAIRGGCSRLAGTPTTLGGMPSLSPPIMSEQSRGQLKRQHRRCQHKIAGTLPPHPPAAPPPTLCLSSPLFSASNRSAMRQQHTLHLSSSLFSTNMQSTK